MQWFTAIITVGDVTRQDEHHIEQLSPSIENHTSKTNRMIVLDTGTFVVDAAPESFSLVIGVQRADVVERQLQPRLRLSRDLADDSREQHVLHLGRERLGDRQSAIRRQGRSTLQKSSRKSRNHLSAEMSASPSRNIDPLAE